MKNITLKIDDEVHSKARVLAAQRGTSISALVRDFLEREAGKSESEDERQRNITSTLREIYAEAEARATPRTEPLILPTRDEIYEERLR